MDDAETSIPETPMTEKTARPQKVDVEKSPEEQARADAIDLRCLSLCIGMLERVNGVGHSSRCIACPHWLFPVIDI